MEFFNSAIDVLHPLVTAIGAGLAVWGAIYLLEGYTGAKRQGILLLMAVTCVKNASSVVRKFPCSMVALTKIIKQIPGHELCYVTRRCRRRRRALAKGLQRVPSAQRTKLPNTG